MKQIFIQTHNNIKKAGFSVHFIIAIALIAVALFAAPPHFSSFAVSTSNEGRLLRIRIEASTPEPLRLELLKNNSLDVLEGSTLESLELVVNRSEMNELKKRGVDFTIVEEGRPYKDIIKERKLKSAQSATVALAAVVSSDYRDLQEVYAEMNLIASQYPAIAQVVDISAQYGMPLTFEGRAIYGLKISDNVTANEDEKTALIVAAHHAREVITPEVALNAAQKFTTQYASSSQITNLVDNNEIWIIPVMNPDGYNYVFTTDNLWRKNRRAFANGDFGVDQNRNYPQGWDAYCSGSASTTSYVYKGPSPVSEPETQTLIALSQDRRFSKVMDFHTYGREVLYGYQCLSHPFTAWMQQEASAIAQTLGYVSREPDAEGQEQEWQFAQMGAQAFLIETHTTFQPPYAEALLEAQRVWPGVLQILERPASVSGYVSDQASGAPLDASVDIENVSFSNGESNSSGGMYGAYHMFVPPGTYTLRFSKGGYASQTHTVTVDTNSSAITLNVELTTGTNPPTANAGPDQLVLDGDQNGSQAITLNGSASLDLDGPLTSYEWKEGSTTLGNGAMLTTNLTVGTHPITLTVIDSDGNSASDDVVITVTSNPITLFFDDFETDKGWYVNTGAAYPATRGIWERANPQDTSSGGPKQLGTTVSGSYDLVTAGLAGSSASANDVDGGKTRILSPYFTLPLTDNLVLTFNYYFAHDRKSSSADSLKARVLPWGETSPVVFQELGTAKNDDAVWATATINLNTFKGKTVSIVFEADDASGDSLIEAAIDNVKVEQK